MPCRNVETHRAFEGSDWGVRKYRHLAFHIYEDISLARRMLADIRTLITTSDEEERRLLREAEAKLADTIRIFGDALNAIDDRANTGIRMDQSEGGRDETD